MVKTASAKDGTPPPLELNLSEFDQSGSLIATYHSSPSSSSGVSVKYPQTGVKPPWQRVLDVFLPAGYPASVTDDYMAYQIYDSLQAFSSSIAGMLASRAVLEGVGVGDPNSHPTTAILLSVLQDSFGRLATILFAHRLGSALEPECKMYRLAADVFNDAAMVMDCLSPAFPRTTRVVLLSASSVLRALCGVAAGSAKASLSAHFAQWGNLGEVNAKDSSQETVISLTGMLAGSLVVSWVSSPLATWITLITLLVIHLGTNYMAVRSVRMRSLNRQRANLVFSHLLAYDKVLTPSQVSRVERIFERDGVLRWADDSIIGFARIGVSIRECLDSVSMQDKHSSRTIGGAHSGRPYSSLTIRQILEKFQGEAYALRAVNDDECARLPGTKAQIHIMLKQDCSAQMQLKAWFQALMLAKDIYEQANRTISSALPSTGEGDSDESNSNEIQAEKAASIQRNTPLQQGLSRVGDTLYRTNKLFDEYAMRLQSAGWELGHATLETHAGPRFSCL